VKLEDVVKGKLDLSDCDGNAAAIIVRVKKALVRAGNPPEVVDFVSKEMRAGDYDHLLQTAMAVIEDP